MAAIRPAPLPRPSLGGTAFSIVLLCVLVAVAGRGCRSWLAAGFLPTASAEWIWAAGATKTGKPLAFYAARDFNVGSQQQQPVELAIAASEEYLVEINGLPVGSGFGGAHPPLDRYEVSSLLIPGLNRIVVEARSSWGAGGLLVSLRADGEGRPMLISDGSWRIFRAHRLDVVRGGGGLESGERPQVWTLPPTGRWRIPRPQPVLAVPALRPPPLQVLLPRRVVRQPDRAEGGPVLVFDFGEEQVGTLRFELRGSGKPGRLWVGDDLATLYDRLPVATVISVAGRLSWQDSVARRLRFAALAGPAQVVTAQLVSRQGDRPFVAAQPMGLLGITPPQPRGGWLAPSSRTPVEDETRGGG